MVYIGRIWHISKYAYASSKLKMYFSNTFGNVYWILGARGVVMSALPPKADIRKVVEKTSAYDPKRTFVGSRDSARVCRSIIPLTARKRTIPMPFLHSPIGFGPMCPRPRFCPQYRKPPSTGGHRTETAPSRAKNRTEKAPIDQPAA